MPSAQQTRDEIFVAENSVGRYLRRATRYAVFAASLAAACLAFTANAQNIDQHWTTASARSPTDLLSATCKALPELAVEQATRETRLAHDQPARARDALAALVAQVRSLEDRLDLRDAQRDLLLDRDVRPRRPRHQDRFTLKTLASPDPAVAENVRGRSSTTASLAEFASLPSPRE